MTKIFLLTILLFFATALNAQRGKDGAKIILGTEIVNAYTSLTTDASVGNTSITVSNTNLNNHFSGNLSAGDLIMLIQIQGVDVEDTIGTTGSNPLDSSSQFFSTWGKILNYNNCGNYELVQVEAVPNSTTINLDCSLSFDYTASGKVIVIRVPRYSSLTINNGGNLTADAWNGTTGGVLAIEVNGLTTINTGGNIDVSSLGFRGGQPENQSTFGGQRYAANGALEGAEKGEGIAGDQVFYDSFLTGRYCRGAAANAGGGGTAHNAGGGGGSNAGTPTNWGNGAGVSDPTYNVSWALETPSLVGASNSGGGRGGYSHTSSNENELTQGPGNAAWAGDNRREVGGLGGRPLDYSTGKIFMGGAGGAGDGNSVPVEAGAGGNGAGIIFISSYGNVTGAGEIIANGQNGGNSGTTASAPFNTVTGKDGAGGAGAGGVIIIKTTGTVSGITIETKGGKGGDQILREGTFANINEAEGPGGGGGGGYIAITTGTPTRNANGGNNGTTDSPFISDFPPNGATSGGVGMPNESIPAFNIIANNDTICPNTTSTLIATINGTTPVGATIEWYDAATSGSLLFTGNTFTTPGLTTTTTYYIRVCPAPFRVPITVTVNACSIINASFSSSDSTLCETDCINFTDLSSGGTITSWSWNFQGAIITTSSLQNPTNICYNTAGNFDVSLVVSDGTNTDSLFMDNFITVITPPNSGTNGTLSICPNDPGTDLFPLLGGSADIGGLWSPALASGTGIFNPTVDIAGTYTYTVTNSCDTSSNNMVVTLTVNPSPGTNGTASFCTNATTVNLFDSLGGTPDTPNASGFWFPPLASGTGVFDPAIDTAGVYTYSVNLCAGGAATADVVVTVDSCNTIPVSFIIPNVFSPNGDSYNDVFNVSGTGLVSIKAKIYNRWGSLIFSSKELINKGWDGRTTAGHKCTEGTYFYIITIETIETSETFKGSLTLIR